MTDEIEALIPTYAALGIPRGVALTMIIHERRRTAAQDAMEGHDISCPIDYHKLRPYTRRGAAYFDELRAILDSEGAAIIASLRLLKARDGKIVPLHLAALALRHNLNCKAICDYLEDCNIFPAGTYQRLRDSGWSPTQAFREAQKEVWTWHGE